MYIDLKELGQEEKRLKFSYHCDELDLDEPELSLPEGCDVELRLFKRRDEVDVKGSVTALFRMSCDRCLNPVDTPVSGQFRLLYLPLEQLKQEDELSLERDELDISFYSDQALDLDALVLEQLRMLIPMSTHCAEDCKGLCTQCGQNLNIEKCTCDAHKVDPRWGELMKLRLK